MDIMTKDEYAVYHGMVELKLAGYVDPHTYRTLLGYIINSLDLLNHYYEKPVETADLIVKYEKLYIDSRFELDELMKKVAISKLPKKYSEVYKL